LDNFLNAYVYAAMQVCVEWPLGLHSYTLMEKREAEKRKRKSMDAFELTKRLACSPSK